MTKLLNWIIYGNLSSEIFKNPIKAYNNINLSSQSSKISKLPKIP